MPRKTDSQAHRSRQWMLEALVSLMEEKSFSQITISEIAARADLDRRTFYRHFATKEDILVYRIRQLSGEYEQILRKGPMDARGISLAFFTLCRQNSGMLQLLHRHRLLPLLLYELNELFPHYHEKYHTGPDIYEPYDSRYALSYHVGGFWNMMIRWLEEGMKKTPEELADTVGHFLPEKI